MGFQADIAQNGGTESAEVRACEQKQAVFPLFLATEGDELCVRSITAAKGEVRRLGDLGLRPGLHIRVVHANPGGVIIAIDGMRLAIGPTAAQKIIVAFCSSAKDQSCS